MELPSVLIYWLPWILWVASLTIVTYASAQIVKKYKQHGFAALVAFYSIYLAAAQVMATRRISLDWACPFFPEAGLICPLIVPASVFIYPFIAQAIDMINEVY
jgi:hypothetical protein